MSILMQSEEARNTADAAIGQDLRGLVRGRVLCKGDEGYDEARLIWNARADRHPAAIVQPVSADDVVAAVNYARIYDLILSVKGGGHGVSSHAAVDGGIMIDFSTMKGIEVDPRARLAVVEPGVTWGELNHATMSQGGLAVPGGKVASVGVAGTTLGGGIGWLVRKLGLTVDHLASVEIVTADGRILTASESEHPDLFWAIRGGGGNFGIVTSFRFRLHEVGTVLSGMVAYPIAQAAEVLTFYRDFIATAPDELTTVAALGHGPEGSPMVMVALTYMGDLEEGDRVVKPLVEFGQPLITMVAPMPYGALGAKMAEMAPSGMYRAGKSAFLNGLSDGAIAAIVDAYSKVTSPLAVVLIEHYGGAMARVPSAATAFAHRGETLNLIIDAGWAAPDEAIGQLTWLANTMQAMGPYAGRAVYVNFLDEDDGDRVIDAYGGEAFSKLATIKAAYDPENLFRMNQNIMPARG
jgi:FAD/FMN-containing dehydrogenase